MFREVFSLPLNLWLLRCFFVSSALLFSFNSFESTSPGQMIPWLHKQFCGGSTNGAVILHPFEVLPNRCVT